MSTNNNNSNNVDKNDDKETSTANANANELQLSTPPPATLLDEAALRTSESSSILQSGSALSSPLLNGEHIVLLSLSTEDITPVVHTPATVDHVNVANSNIHDELNDDVHSLTLVHTHTEESEVVSDSDSAQVQQVVLANMNMNVHTPESHNEEEDDNNIGNIIITQELFPRNNNNNNNFNVDHNREAYSPPPESIIQSELLSLSPPPLSLKSDGHRPYNVVHHHHDHSMSGTQSLFSGGGATNTTNGGGASSVVSSGLFDYGVGAVAAQPFPIPTSTTLHQPPHHHHQLQQQPPSTSSINNNTASKQQKQRPPLPPRWAIGTSTDHHHHHHYHPPKQVGTLSHRRVLSTGDASIMSILTDPDCGLENSPVWNSVERNNGSSGSSGVLPIGGRKRGVSWDVQLPVLTGGGEEHFSTEEQAAFSALGILQPVLMDGDEEEYGDDTEHDIGFTSIGLEDLMQPVLDDDDPDDAMIGMEHSQQATITAQRHIAPQAGTMQPLKPPSSFPTTPPPPPQSLPPNSLSRSKSTNSSSHSRRTMFAKSKRGQNTKSITQFEDEANKAIMEALSMYNLEHSEILGDTALQPPSTMKREEHDDDLDEGDDDDLGDDIPHQVVRHVPPKTDIHSFEDAAWHDGYDSLGRIDGTLVEERESKYIEDELGIDSTKLDDIIGSDGGLDDVVDSGSVKQVVVEEASSMSESDQISVAESHHSRATDVSRASKGSRASKSSRSSREQQQPISTKKGLRHRRGGTRGTVVLSAAQELAAMDTIEESDEIDSNAFKIESDGHGVDNLLEGATLLLQQQEKLEGTTTSSDDDETMSFIAEETSDDIINEHDSFQDEETGVDHSNNKKQHKRTPTHLFGKRQKPTKRDRQMERRFRMKMWYKDLIAPRLPIFITAATHSFLFVIIPLLFLAIILYYVAGNPVAGGRVKVETELIESTSFRGSWSWWVLFILRQFIVLSLVKMGEVIFIDIIALRTPIFVKVFGSFVTLMFVQARGWPYVLTFWGVFDIATLYGNNSFARHWLFWQNLVGLCNDENPAADFLHGGFYLRLLLSMVFIGVVTSLKRLTLAAFLGRRSFIHYGPEFELILAKMVLVSQVAQLARRIEANVATPSSALASGFAYTMTKANFAGLLSDSDDFEAGSPTEALDKSDSNSVSSQHGFGESMRKSVYGKKLISSLSRNNVGLMDGRTRGNSSSKVEMMKLLEEWEEPDLQANAASKVSIKDVLQFRQAVSLVSDTYPFTQSFGPAATRSSCVESAEQIFNLLLSKSPNTQQKLPFETIVELAEGKDGELLHDKVKALVRLFRPDRKGFLTKLDFVTSIDQVYRELRLFRANLSNSQQIDESFHGLINILHYFLVILVVLIIMGFNNWESLLSMTAFFFSFSFLFGPASSKYFEGILLIFVRRPYDIGDKVAISDPENDTSSSGSSTWFVEKVSLYSTTVRFATTNEVATYSNGSLARLRIINAKRSPKAIVYVYNKFGSDVPYKLIQVFKASVENFVKSRPREWAQLNGFRATRVNLELNFIEYVIVLTHRELWQNIAPILQSKADLASFCLEVSKMLNLRYEQPPKPIHLSLEGRHHDERSSYGDDGSALSSGLQQVRDMFKKDD